VAGRIAGTRSTRWGIAAYVRVGGRAGRQYQKTFPRGTARWEIEEWRAGIFRQQHRPPDSGTLAAAIDGYLESLGPPSTRRRTSGETALTQWRGEYGDRPRLSLTYEDCRDFMARMRADGFGGQLLEQAPRLPDERLPLLRRGQPDVPGSQVEARTGAGAAPRGHDPAVIRQAIETMPLSRTKARTALLAATGMRPSEVMRLGPGDFHLQVQRPYLVVRTAQGGQPRLVPLNNDGVVAARLFIETNAFGKFSRDSLRMSFHRS
jgi:integrase